MTMLASMLKAAGFGTNTAPTTLTVRDDIITTTRVLGDEWGSLALSNDYTATYEEIVRKQLWARIVVNKLAYSIAHLPLKVYERDDDGREQARDSALARLLEWPNSTKETGNQHGFWARVGQDFFTYGNALILKAQTRPDEPPLEMRPVSPRGWFLNENGDYIHRSPVTGKESDPFKPWQVIHIMEPGPTVSGFGVSRLEAARLTLSIEYAAQQLGAATFNNGARPGGIINVKNIAGADKAEVIERMKSEIVRRFGGVAKSGLPAVLEGDTTWMPMSYNLDDSAVVAHRQLTREELAALYDIPQPTIGILDEANFASIDALHLMFYQDTLGWPIGLFEDAIKAQLIRDVPEFADQFAEFDMNAMLRGNMDKRSQTYQRLISVGVMTQNEARDKENWKRSTQPEADQLHTPVFLSPNPATQEADNQGGVR